MMVQMLNNSPLKQGSMEISSMAALAFESIAKRHGKITASLMKILGAHQMNIQIKHIYLIEFLVCMDPFFTFSILKMMRLSYFPEVLEDNLFRIFCSLLYKVFVLKESVLYDC